MNLNSLKINNSRRYSSVSLTRDYSAIARRLFSHKARYQVVEKITGVPWPVIAAIHERESDMNFNTQLAQGDPLSIVSTHVPRGQGPYYGSDAWERAAGRALIETGGNIWGDWTPGGWTTYLEKYNGLGYYNKANPSPYVWAGTNQYHSGKYVADGVYSESAIDTQPGCVNLIINLAKLDSSINLNNLSAKTTTTPIKETKHMNSLTFNWKTTLAGITAILTAVGAFVSAGSFDPAHWSALAAAVAAGIGMIFAKDSNVTNSPTPTAAHTS